MTCFKTFDSLIMDIIGEVDLNLNVLFGDININENLEDVNDVKVETEEDVKGAEIKDEEEEEDEYLDDGFTGYDFVNNDGEVETFWTFDTETCTISFDIEKATQIKKELEGKRKFRVARKMDDKEISPSRDEVRNQEFFARYHPDTDSVHEFSFNSSDVQ